MTSITLNLPDNLYEQLQRQAQLNQQSIDELAQATIRRFLPAMFEIEQNLPSTLQTELKAMEHLSDAALWSLARSGLGEREQAELARLSEIQKDRALTPIEKQQQQSLLNLYDEMLLRRSHAAILLQARGFNVTTVTVSETT